ncbi:YbaB/EbfC family nucleoid-associated protein [Hamadaea tsunoensis]|uniref:YbaB/EbfC family nucleoid-associated protein n=1 Tax=Hamadaea tsunoensis TaxID=53368 RepID=UPI0003F877CC|nr:YbaB/EbfC family nucleoid-associated protein [Hamadaea tsunoensis]
MFFQDLDDAESFVDDWAARAAERAQQAQDMATRLQDLSVKATSRDGNVTVSVDNAGVPTDIRLDPEVERWPAQRIAEAVLATMRAAQAQLRKQVREVAAETIGADSEAGRHVLASYDRFSAEDPENGGNAR